MTTTTVIPLPDGRRLAAPALPSSATSDERVRVFTAVLRREPALAWELAGELWARHDRGVEPALSLAEVRNIFASAEDEQGAA